MRVFISAWVGAGNLGDELLFGCLLRRLRAAGVDAIATASLNPQQTRGNFGVEAHGYRNVVRTAIEIWRSDYFILGPGGILQDDTSPWSLPYQLYKPLLAKLFRVPVMGMGLGAGPLRRSWSNALLRFVLGSARTLVVRDEESAALLRAAGLPRVQATADLVLSSTIPEAEVQPRIAVCLRPHKVGGSTLPVMFQADEIDDTYVHQLAGALDDIATQQGKPCHFIPFEPHRDGPFHAAVAARMKTPVTHGQVPAEGLLREVATCDAVVAMRFHSAIAAILTLKPTVMIGYAPKVTSLAARLDGVFRYIPNEADAFSRLPSELALAVQHETDSLHARRDELRHIESRNTELLGAFLRGEPPQPG